MRNEYSHYFGWCTDRECTVYLHNNEPVGATPITEALEIAVAATEEQVEQEEEPHCTEGA